MYINRYLKKKTVISTGEPNIYDHINNHLFYELNMYLMMTHCYLYMMVVQAVNMLIIDM